MMTAACQLFAGAMLWALISHPTPDPLRAGEDMIDLELIDEGYRLGLVTAIMKDNEICIIHKDLFDALGMDSIVPRSSCLALDELKSDYGVSIEVDLRNMRAVIQSGTQYPAKAYAEAKKRLAIKPSPHEPTYSIVNRRYSVIPELRHMSATVQRYSASGLNPDLLGAASGDIFGGNAHIGAHIAEYGTTGSYKLLHLGANLRYVLKTRYNIIRSIDLGTHLVDRDATAQLRGLRFSNIPLSRRLHVADRRFVIHAPPGSIIEWMPQSSLYQASIVGEEGRLETWVPLGYGLNQIQYLVTQPNQLTQSHRFWQRIPSRIIPAKTFEYEILYGQRSNTSTGNVAVASASYGVSRALSISAFIATSYQNGDQNKYGNIELVAAPTPTTDILWAMNSNGKNRVQMSYWNPGGLSVDVGSTPSHDIFKHQLQRDYRHNFGNVTWRYRSDGRLSIQADGYLHEKGSQNYVEASWLQTFNSSSMTLSIGRHGNIPHGYRSSSKSYSKAEMVRRVGRRILLTPELQLNLQPTIGIDAIRTHAYYNAQKVQLGFNAYHLPAFNQSGVGVSFKLQTDVLQVTTRNDISSRSHHAYQSARTAWSKSDPGYWHPSAQSGPMSSGIQLIAFHDLNANGKRDISEPELRGLRGHTTEARSYRNRPDAQSLMFTELQPHRQYKIVLDRRLSTHHDHIIPIQVWLIESPGSGISTVYVPVVTSVEAEGTWKLEAISPFDPSLTRLVFTSLHQNDQYEASLFSDGTWYLDAIPAGVYRVQARGPDGSMLSVGSDLIMIDGNIRHELIIQN